MSDNRPDPLSDKIDRFSEKYRLWLVIPLIVSALLAIQNPYAGLSLFIFFLVLWFFIAGINIILNAIGFLLPNKISPDNKKSIVESCAATLFLGGFAVTGMVLRGDNLASKFVKEKLPDGAGLGFIDPISAAIVLICFWVYTIYQILR